MTGPTEADRSSCVPESFHQDASFCWVHLKKWCGAVHVFSDERLHQFCSRVPRRKDLEVADVGKALNSLAFLKNSEDSVVK